MPPLPSRKRVVVALAAFAVALLVSFGIPRLARPAEPPPPAPKAELALSLLSVTTLAAAAAPALLAHARASTLAFAASGAALGALLVAAPGGSWLLGKALAGLLYPALLTFIAGGLVRRRGDSAATERRVLLASLPGLALLMSVFVAGPLLSLAPDPGAALAVLLRASAVTSLAGSLLEIDVLRVAPLYTALPVASEVPFAYPSYATTLLLPGALAAAAVVSTSSRRRKTCVEAPIDNLRADA